jgi:dienelactone hydrolase
MLLRLIAALSLAASLHAKIVGQDLDYNAGSTTCQGFIAYDDSKPKAPGILIVHQWMGLTDYEKGRAKQLAALGYVAFCADIYGKGVRPTSGDEAGKLAGTYKGNRQLYRDRLMAALNTLKEQTNVDSSKTAAIGYCFGGTGVLELARAGADTLGVVCFHGGLDSPDPNAGKNIKAKILILHGADDPFSKKADIEAMEDEFKAAKVDYQIHFYSGAVHAFTQPMAGNDPSKGIAYNAVADRRSWLAMKDFFNELFSKD